ncbi:MAG: S8 family serine peptidase [Bacteroidetes bacterium]|nr:S8 family serine peptidase [Bacteroidota bacterium]
MKKYLFLLLLSSISIQTFSQFSNKMAISLQRKMKMTETARSSGQEIALFLRGDVAAIKQLVTELGGTYKYAAGDISAVRIPISKVSDLAASNAVTWLEDNNLQLKPMNDVAIVTNKVNLVHQGVNLPQGYDGTHVVVGIIDEGIYAAHHDFRDPSTNRTRVKWLWDQTLVVNDTSVIPQPYNYGMELDSTEIDTSTLHHDGPSGHGTHVTGIACGNGSTVNNYKGMAPNSDIIVVKMNLNVPDNEFLSSLVDAVKYVFDKADEMGEPAVVNISLGTYFGSHDGRDIQAQAIANLINQSSTYGHMVVASAGNAGTAPIHLGYDVTPDTSFTWFQFSNPSIYLEMWGDSADFANVQFSVGCDRVKPDYKLVGSLPFTNVTPYLNQDIIENVYSGPNRVGRVEHAAQYVNGTYQVQFAIVPDSIQNINGPDTSKYYWRLMTKGSGHFDCWSFNMVPSGLPDSSAFPSITQYKTPDVEQTIVSSFQCNDNVITVGSYDNRNSYANANFTQTVDTAVHPYRLSVFSSHGPTRDGRIKPDITAPGGWVLSAGPNYVINGLLATEPQKVAAGGQHFRSSGTSMSGPMVAGMCALYLQRYPNATWQDVKNDLLSCTTTDNFTGNNLPDYQWGYGKANAYNLLRGCIISVDENELHDNDLSSYPNPFSDHTTISFSLPSSALNAEIVISDVLGKTIEKVMINNNMTSIDLKKGAVKSGLYFCTLVINGKPVKTTKLAVM